MELRKLVKAGTASHTVSLPKKWLESNNLGKGDTLYIIEKSSKELLIRPDITEKAQEHKKITIITDKKEITTIKREIIAAYVNNYHIITIIGDNLSENISEIRKLLHDFVAMEIIEQTKNRLVAQDLLNPTEIDIYKTLKRIDMIIRSILIDCSELSPSIKDSIYYRDFDVNKLRYLVTRLIYSALEKPDRALELGISNIEAVNILQIVGNLEKISDNIVNIAKLHNNLSGSEKEVVGRILYKLKQDHDSVLNSYHSKKKDLAEQVMLKKDQYGPDFEALIKEGNSTVYDIVERLKKINRFILDCALITINTAVV